MGLLGYLEQTAFCGPGNPAVGGLCFHKHDIGADFFDAVPGNYVIIPAACHSQKAAGTGNHNGTDFSFRNVNLDIGDESQPLAGADTDDLLALEVGKFHGHGRSLPIRLHQFMQREVRKER